MPRKALWLVAGMAPIASVAMPEGLVLITAAWHSGSGVDERQYQWWQAGCLKAARSCLPERVVAPLPCPA